MNKNLINLLAIFIVAAVNICVYCGSENWAEVSNEVISVPTGEVSSPETSKKETIPLTSEARAAATPEARVVVTAEAKIMSVTPEVKEEVFGTAVIPTEEGKVEYFNDLPEKHWAANAVNRLVKMGLTQGYPDGTFRGSNYITRYETAIFLSKMAHQRRIRNSIHEKILEELKAEVYKIRYTLDFYKKEPLRRGPITGHFNANTRFGNLVSGNAAFGPVSAPMGPVFDYRLLTSYRQEFKGGSYIKLTLDTMDSGFSANRDFIMEMFDFEGGVDNPGSVGIKMTAGPGTIVHREPTNIFPSEDFKAYLRPKNSITTYYYDGILNAGIRYQTTSTSKTGLTPAHDIGLFLDYEFKNTPFGRLKLNYTLDNYLNDIRAGFATMESTINIYSLILMPDTKNEFGIKIGASSYLDPQNNEYFGMYYISKGIIGEGSKLKISFNKIGLKFLNSNGDLEQDDILGVNLFEKLFKNGTNDIGFEISQRIAEGRSFRVKTDIVLDKDGRYAETVPDAEAAIELNMDFGLFDDAVMTIGYRIYQKPSLATNTTSDILGIGFNYYY